MAIVLQMGTELYPLLTASLLVPPILFWMVARYGVRKVSPLQWLLLFGTAALAFYLALGPYLEARASGQLFARSYFRFAALTDYLPGGSKFPGIVSVVLAVARYASATRQGLDEETIAQVHLPKTDRRLEPRDSLAVRYAEKMATDFHEVDSAFLAELREHFSDAEIVELGLMIGQYLALGRMLVITGNHRAACEIYAPDI